MANLYSRYIWLIDTIRRYGSVTRRQIDECWLNSPHSNGRAIPRRTLFNYRQAIADIFKIDIVFNPATNTYSIAEEPDESSAVTDWMLNSASLTDILADAREVAGNIFLEDVPSARLFLPLAVTALKEHRRLTFDYHPYTRSTAKTGITVEPYFLKIFRQRWYVTGLNTADKAVKTYALDRISNAILSTETYSIPADFNARDYFRHSFGIIFNHGEVKEIVIKADSQQSKYLRALPLHHSQTEEISDTYSVFTYRMKISEDLVSELLSYGPKITVLRPAELRAILTDRLRRTLENY